MFITVLRHAELDKAIALIGSVRGCYLILTRQELNAETPKNWGAVDEIVTADELLTRAREIAEGLTKLPPLTTHYASIVTKNSA